ncbi:MAG: phage tail protein [Saprospiraceae bacterium]
MQDSFVLTSLSQAEFYRHQPIDFFLIDENGNANLYILNDNMPGRSHHLVVLNEDEHDLRIASGSGTPGRTNHHFELRFRPGSLEAQYRGWVSAGVGEWRLHAHLWTRDTEVPDGTISIYLLYHSDAELVLPGKSSKLIPLHGLKAGQGGGSRSGRAQLRYRRLGDAVVPGPDANAVLFFRQERLEVVNQRGRRDIPLHAAFSTGYRVLNIGATKNQLTLSVTNRLRNNFIAFQGKNSESPTRLVLAFDTTEAAENWALFDEDNALAVLVDIRNESTFWHIEKEVQGATPQWILSPGKDVELDAGESFHIHLENIISAMPAGTANLYLQHENIPGYWDSSFTVPVEKTPFFIKETVDEKGNPKRAYVGIGTHELDTNDEDAVLQVAGGISAEFMELSSGGFIPRGGIIMWSGEANLVPKGWKICDGNNGQPVEGLTIPDLRSRFIVGAGQGPGLSIYAPGGIGGEETHTLSKNELPAHNHTADSGTAGLHRHDIPIFTDNEGPGINQKIIDLSGLGKTTYTQSGVTSNRSATTEFEGSHTHTITVGNTGDGKAHENRPPYFALAFIIKL